MKTGPKPKYKTSEEKRIGRNLKGVERTKKYRVIVLQYYSKSTIPFCACCGEKEYSFLSIDHINGGGTKHRKEFGVTLGKGGTIIQWIKRNNFPDGFQILCHNCNMAKGFYGKCPHNKD